MDIILGTEMKTTGEVMGIALDLGMAFTKSQMAADATLPTGGNISISVKAADRPNVFRIAKGYAHLRFTLYATSGTGSIISEAGFSVSILPKLARGHSIQTIELSDHPSGWSVIESRIASTRLLLQIPQNGNHPFHK